MAQIAPLMSKTMFACEKLAVHILPTRGEQGGVHIAWSAMTGYMISASYWTYTDRLILLLLLLNELYQYGPWFIIYFGGQSVAVVPCRCLWRKLHDTCLLLHWLSRWTHVSTVTMYIVVNRIFGDRFLLVNRMLHCHARAGVSCNCLWRWFMDHMSITASFPCVVDTHIIAYGRIPKP